MNNVSFPPLSLSEWRDTRDTLRGYAQLLGKIRQSLTPPQPHWWHVSLRVTNSGLTTTPMPIPGTEDTVEIRLDLLNHNVIIEHSRQVTPDTLALSAQSIREFRDQVLERLAAMDVRPAIDRSLFDSDQPGVYDRAAVTRYFRAASAIDGILKQFKSELSGRTSPVQLWPHHFDLSLVWFSGRKVPDVDPADEEYSDEQMAFGFSTGDEGIPEPYIYITAYPWPEQLGDMSLPAPALWHLETWKGALIMYDALREFPDPAATLLDVLRAAQKAGASLMG